MNIEIRGQAGRLGNFLMQIKHALHIALHNNYNVILPKHKFINTTYIVINKNISIGEKKIIHQNLLILPFLQKKNKNEYFFNNKY